MIAVVWIPCYPSSAVRHHSTDLWKLHEIVVINICLIYVDLRQILHFMSHPKINTLKWYFIEPPFKYSCQTPAISMLFNDITEVQNM